MELEFRKDFEAVAARWDAFWKGGEELARPLVSIIVPRPGVEPAAKPEETFVKTVLFQSERM
jgi:hypothetical protein